MGYYGCSNFILKWMNALSLVLSLPIIIVGIYLSTGKGSECYTFLQKPVLVIGVAIFIVSLLGFVGAAKSWSVMLWMYLFFMGILILLLLCFTIFAFSVTAQKGGATAPGSKFKEYNLEDYSAWFQSQINDTKTWGDIRSCMVVGDYCEHLNRDYKDLTEYKEAKLSPTEAGCCRPPSKCAFTQTNMTTFTIPSTSLPEGDCSRWSNNLSTMCFDCDTCKGGVAQYVRESWQTGSVVLLVVVVLLMLLYCVGCCARYNAQQPEFEQLQSSQFSSGYQRGYQGGEQPRSYQGSIN